MSLRIPVKNNELAYQANTVKSLLLESSSNAYYQFSLILNQVMMLQDQYTRYLDSVLGQVDTFVNYLQYQSEVVSGSMFSCELISGILRGLSAQEISENILDLTIDTDGIFKSLKKGIKFKSPDLEDPGQELRLRTKRDSFFNDLAYPREIDDPFDSFSKSFRMSSNLDKHYYGFKFDHNDEKTQKIPEESFSLFYNSVPSLHYLQLMNLYLEDSSKMMFKAISSTLNLKSLTIANSCLESESKEILCRSISSIRLTDITFINTPFDDSQCQMFAEHLKTWKTLKSFAFDNANKSKGLSFIVSALKSCPNLTELTCPTI